MCPPTRARKTGSQRTPTIQDVSRLAGVSTATVSRALGNQDAVSEATRQRVFEAVQALNYQLNRNARNLRRSTTSKIGVLVSDIQNPFFGTVIRGIEKVTIQAGYTIILGNSDEDLLREKKLLTMLLEEGVAGIIFVPAGPTCASYAELFHSGTPCVVIDRKITPCEADMVIVDGYHGTIQAVECLIGLGHTRIGFVGGLDVSTIREREKGYQDALVKHGLALPEGYIQRGNNRQDGGYQAMKDLMALKSPPSAVVTANNLMTIGSLKAIHELGFRIPQQLSLIGFDDMDWAPSLQPPLSVVAQPAFEMGEKAAGVLLERIQDPAMPRKKILLKTELILRDSCQGVPE